MYSKGILYSITVILICLSIAHSQPAVCTIPVYPIPSENAGIDEVNRYATEQWSLGNYQEALAYFSKAYKQANMENNEQMMAHILNNLGLVYWSLQDNMAAMEYYKEAAKIAEKVGHKLLLGLTYTNRALILKEQDDYTSALDHNKKAIRIFSENDHPRELAITLNNHGQIFKVQEKMDSALYYYTRALDIYFTIDYKDGMAATYHNLADVYMYKDKERLALEYAQKSLELGLAAQSKVRISEAYKKLSEIYEYFSHPDSALEYHKKYADFQIKTLSQAQSERLAEYEAQMRTEIKTLRIQNLEKEKTIAVNRMWLSIGAITIVMLIIFFFIYRNLYRTKLKTRQLESELINSQEILNIKELELKSYIIDLSKKNMMIHRLQDQISKEIQGDEQTDRVAQLLNQKILTDDDWKMFKTKFNTVYPYFFAKIKQMEINLTEAEIRFLVLFRLNLTGKEMADMLGISPQSVRALKMRLKKKLSIGRYKSVEEFLYQL